MHKALEHLQSDEQIHGFLLFASRHLLALFKCFFYYFAFKLVGTKFVPTRNEELPGKLFLQSKYGGKQEEIRRLQPDEAHKTLGCHISVDMSQEKQLEIVRDIILNWTRRINSSPLSTSDRMYAYKSILEKKAIIHPSNMFVQLRAMSRIRQIIKQNSTEYTWDPEKL